ncbi:hypothetical protein SAMN05444392_10213 [Seinonella peptonophila]|uniref:UPF0122 protein SAMN05444392_10213 n=1 Tax=Seinonella peptonophila TaxID=112248 RepID=A0A1M4USY1_9BACL|nr:sigma factor-like helix-turn-helix DNA-binding protein [Seinonella peptonophila]SHE59842.1 hypothetical protein SAMN05444392_10213 [Seinonella peptonophila]
MFLLEEKIELNQLYDFYGQLLRPKQRALLEMYYLDDWSLAEIAEHQAVSRQAIFESLKRAQRALIEFERKLQLVEKHRQRLVLVEQIRQQAHLNPELADKLETWLNQLLAID